ncbi:hypothetical protein H4W31_003909 [Plantactinospora soyae]|uniref:Uncharacterized protein n=1 Tax=Plantactinospora soyae TaxID=1544732 RepID=A0A927M7Z9_9ACTN|nr:hypothetical protein [Plantactinospora soyae]
MRWVNWSASVRFPLVRLWPKSCADERHAVRLVGSDQIIEHPAGSDQVLDV